MSGDELSALMDGKYARVIRADWQTDDTKLAKTQRMVRGNVALRGGELGSRLESERCVVIKAAKNLGRANTGAMLGVGSSDPFVEVTINGAFFMVPFNLLPLFIASILFAAVFAVSLYPLIIIV